MLTKNLALISQSHTVSADDLNEVAAAIQKQVTRDLEPIWGIKATINVFKHLNAVPTGYWPIVIKDNIHQTGAGGFHSQKHNQPFALIQAGSDWIISTGHEVLEMLVDPWGNQTVTGDSIKPGQGRVCTCWKHAILVRRENSLIQLTALNYQTLLRLITTILLLPILFDIALPGR